MNLMNIKKLIIAYDFDNTVYDYHKKGHTYDDVVALLRKAKQFGCYLIVFTSAEKERYPDIKKYLRDNNIPYDSINENCPDTSNFKGRKIYYNILLDDRAGLISAYRILNSCLGKIK